jgi:hypothetical protein
MVCMTVDRGSPISTLSYNATMTRGTGCGPALAPAPCTAFDASSRLASESTMHLITALAPRCRASASTRRG